MITRERLLKAAFADRDAHRRLGEAMADALYAEMRKPSSRDIVNGLAARGALRFTKPTEEPKMIELENHAGKRYVAGAMFSHDQKRVALMRKNRPEWQKGHLNFHGGRIEIGESPVGAMIRETLEETGVMTRASEWFGFHTERYRNGNIVHFYARIMLEEDELVLCSPTDEKVSMFPVEAAMNVRWASPLYNIHYLVPMALSYINNPDYRYLEG